MERTDYSNKIKMFRNEIMYEIKRLLEKQEKQELHIDENTKIGLVESSNSVPLSSLEYVDFIVDLEHFFGIIVDFDLDLFVVRDIINFIIEYDYDSIVEEVNITQ